MGKVKGSRDVHEMQFLYGFTIELLFSSQKPGKSSISCPNPEISIVEPRRLAFQISEHFLRRIHPAVVLNVSANPQPSSERSIDWKPKMLNDDFLGVVGGQHGEKKGEGVVICKISGLSADSRSFFCRSRLSTLFE
jgi:hypothetical protein